jgi:O-antigen/teichoic acid export membrane protein
MQVTVPLAMVMFPKIARATAAGTRSDALALALMGTLILGSLAAGFVTLFPRFPLMIVYFNKPEALAAAPVVPWYAWAMVAYTMANVLVSNLLARGRFWIVAWALGITGAYLGTLALIRPHLMGLEPSAVFRTVPQLIDGYSLLLLTIAAWLTWGPGSKPRTACP